MGGNPSYSEDCREISLEYEQKSVTSVFPAAESIIRKSAVLTSVRRELITQCGLCQVF